MCCRGKLDEKLQFCFSMFDLSGDGFIAKVELHKCLTSTAFASFALLQAVAVEQGFMGDEDCLQPTEFEKEVDTMVDDAFSGSDVNDDGKLSFDEFKRWLLNTPEVVGIVYSVFDMRGHVDMNHIEKQFDDSRKQMDKDDRPLEIRLAESESAKQLADALAAKLLVENSQLLKQVQELQEENAKLRGNTSKRK